MGITDPHWPLGPYGRIGSIVNVMFCAALIVSGVIVGIVESQPAMFLFAGVGVILEIVFVRIMLRARQRERP